MQAEKTNLRLAILAASFWIAAAGWADAAVIIKTFRCAICVTDVKHPDACKNVPADGRAVVSEDALQGLEGELGQGATIMMATGVAPKASGDQQRRRRHQPGQDSSSTPQ